MNKFQSQIKISGILGILVGVFTLKYFLPYSIVELLIGMLLLFISTQDINDCYKNKTLLSIIAIILVFLNIIQMIFIVLAIDNMESYMKNNNDPPKKSKKKQIEEMDPEVKKINVLLKLGVFLVLISGILFATTSWNNITVVGKGLGLILFGTIFLGLSYFTEIKLKLKKTSFVYCLLSMFFYVFTWICACYFKLFGNFLSFTGTGSKIVISISSIIIALLMYYMYKRFKEENLLYIIYTAILTCIYFILDYLKVPYSLISGTLAAFFLLVNIFLNNKSSLFKYSKYATFLIWIIILLDTAKGNNISLFVGSIINIVNIQMLYIKNKQNDSQLTLLLSYFILFYCFLRFENSLINNLIMMIIITIYTLFVNRSKLFNKESKDTNYIIYTIATILMFIKGFSNEYTLLLITLIYLVVSIVEYFIYKNDNKILKVIQPIAIALFFYSMFNYTSINLSKVYIQDYFTLLTTIFVLFQVIIRNKDKELTNEYYYFGMTSFIIAILMNLSKVNLVMCLFILFISIFLLVLYKDNKSKYKFNIVLLMFNIYTILCEINILNISNIYTSILTIILFVALLYMNRKDKSITAIVNFAICVPLYKLMNSFNIDYEMQLIAGSLFFFYILYLALVYILKKDNSKDIFTIIISILILSNMFFEEGLILAIYIGIVGFIFIIIGYYLKDYSKLFYLGIFITVINIIYRLLDFWSKIPFWIYLLCLGLILIGFVTYKEMKKSNK